MDYCLKKTRYHLKNGKTLARKKLKQYKDFTIRFTDGSKIEEKTGYAVVSVNGLICSSRLADHTSVYTAEQMGVLHAARDPTSRSKVAIFTDSISTILALMSRDDKNPSTLHLINLLEELKKEIVLIWIPSHQGISGNERADKEAKLAAESQIVFDPTYQVKDALNIIERCETDAAIQMWSLTEDKHNFLRSIKRDSERFEFPQEMKRRDERILTRVRLGHTRFTMEHVFHGHYNKMCEFCIAAITKFYKSHF